MPFGPIVVNSKTFNQQGDGRYGLSTLSFGDPANYFTVRGGQLNKARTDIISAVTRTLQQDVTVGTSTQRLTATAQLIWTVPKQGFTSTNMDILTSDISEWVTAAILDRIYAGES